MDPTLCKISEKWFLELGVDKHVYATDLLLTGSPTDGLFPVLVASFLEFVITVAHHQGLWTTNLTATGTIEDDIFLVFTDQDFCHLLPAADALVSCFAPSWQELHHDWSTVPPMLWAPITDLAAIAHSIGYVPKSQVLVSLWDFLSDIVGAPLEEYHLHLVDWIREHKSLAMIQDWFSSQGSNWHLY